MKKTKFENIKNFFKKHYYKCMFAFLIIAILFSISPSCGKNNFLNPSNPNSTGQTEVKPDFIIEDFDHSNYIKFNPNPYMILFKMTIL